MPPKIKQLKAALSKAGFSSRPGKSSHTVWVKAEIPGLEVILSGKDGDDAKKYQIKQVQKATRRTGEK